LFVILRPATRLDSQRPGRRVASPKRFCQHLVNLGVVHYFASRFFLESLFSAITTTSPVHDFVTVAQIRSLRPVGLLEKRCGNRYVGVDAAFRSPDVDG